MSSFPLVSVVVTTFNRPSSLESCLLRLSLQTFKHFEIIVVDDFSDILNSTLSASHCQLYNNVSYVLNTSNLGLAASRMEGVSFSKGEIILFLDDDICVDPEYINVHYHALVSNPSSVTIGSLSYYYPYISISNTTKYFHGLELRQSNKEFIKTKPGNFGGGISGIPKKLFLLVGGYDISFTHYGSEDVDLGIRLHLAGIKIIYLCNAKAVHIDLVKPDRMKIKVILNSYYGLPYLFKKYKNIYILGFTRGSLCLIATSAAASAVYYFFMIVEAILYSFCVLIEGHGSLYFPILYKVLFFIWSYIGLYMHYARKPVRLKLEYSD